jgi:teichuronic acid exporter
MSPLLPVLCAAGILGSFNALNDGLYTSLGRADILLRVVIVEKIALVAMIIAGMFFGLQGIAYARLAAQAFSFVLRVHQQKRVIDVSFMFWARSFMKIIFAGIVMIVTVVPLKSSLADFSLIFRFLIVVCMAIMSFFISLLLQKEEILYKLRDVLYDFRRKKA